MKKLILSFVVGASLVSMSYAQDTTSTSTKKVKEKKEKSGMMSGKSCSKSCKMDTSSYSFTSKNGHEVLPQKGDCALGFAANNLLNYIGDFGNVGSTNFGTTKSTSLTNLTNTIFAKYMVSGSTAHRLTVGFDFNSYSETFQLDDDLNVNSDEFVEDVSKEKNSAIMIALGVEKRRGTSRIQGLYGWEGIIGKDFGTKYKYEYGNELSASNQDPTSTGFGDPTGLYNPTPFDDGRVISAKDAGSFLLGVRGFVGVEYFVAPKLSLGAELYWGVSYRAYGSSWAEYETWDPINGTVVNYESEEEKGDRDFNIGMSNAGGVVNMFFYF